MGDVAEMMLDGTLCCECGVALDGDECGYPVACDDCKSEKKQAKPKKKKKAKK